jgi:hypothetical protein
MAWTTNAYCILADVKTAMNVTSTTDDTWIGTLITQAQADIDRFLSFSFQEGVGTQRVYDGQDADQLWVDDFQSITQVLETVYNPYIGANGAYTLGNPQTIDITADCIFQPNNALVQSEKKAFYLLRRLSGLPFQFGRQNYAITGTWGYASIPLPVARACVLLTIHYYKRRDATYGQTAGSKQFGTKMQPSEDMPEEVRCMLEKYRPRLFLSRGR